MEYNTVRVKQHNEAFMKVISDQGIERELHEFFTFKAPGYQFNPKFKARIWDGQIRLYKIREKTLYRGLLPYVEKFCEERDYRCIVELDDSTENFSLHECEEFLKTLNLPFDGREYQVKAITECIREGRGLLLSPTASGKSFIIYALLRYYAKRTLLIVPTTSLVHQMFSDFEDYSEHDPTWESELMCSKVMSGMSKEGLNPIVISTWQSAIKQSNKWFEQFDMVIVDEAHQAKAKSITTIMERMPHVSRRFGTTGTLDGLEVHQLVLEGLFGKIIKVTDTKELMDKKYLADLHIKCIMLRYGDDARRLLAQRDNSTYPKEVKFLVGNDKRNDFIVNLALSLKGNTLILYQYIDTHGEILYSKLKDKAKDKNIEFVHGGVKSLAREDVRKNAEKTTDNILVCSYGTFSTGVNLVNLQNVIFASPYQSRIRILQSIGRGLRRSEQKTKCVLFDISDDLCWKNRKNHTYKHLEARLKIYMKERFSWEFYKVKLDK